MSNEKMENLLAEVLGVLRQIRDTMPIPLKPKPRSREKEKWPAGTLESLAIAALYRIGPNKTQIARHLECSRRHLQNLTTFNQAYQLSLEAKRRAQKKGFKTADGDIEAWE